jgi:hypothetical protein
MLATADGQVTGWIDLTGLLPPSAGAGNPFSFFVRLQTVRRKSSIGSLLRNLPAEEAFHLTLNFKHCLRLKREAGVASTFLGLAAGCDETRA